ncbi:MAG TPA: transposase, partial [Streptosporangiaceae bacterium]
MRKAVEAELIIRVDTHLDTHTAALCDARGRAVSHVQVAATSAGYAQLLQWADSATAGRPVAWAIEGTRHDGLGLARYLAGSGHQVGEMDATPACGQAPRRKERPDRRRARGPRAGSGLFVHLVPSSCWFSNVRRRSSSAPSSWLSSWFSAADPGSPPVP